MRTYRKAYISENLLLVSHRPTNLCSRQIALQVPHTTAQIINAYNTLSLGFVPNTDFGQAFWTAKDGAGVLQFTISGLALANDVFQFVDYASHPLN